MLTIYLKDLIVTAKHGVHQHEKIHAQRFSVTVEVLLETSANTSDRLEDTLNWSDLRQVVINVVQSTSFNLIERLAQHIADEILKTDNRINKLTVAIDKLDAFESGVPGIKLISEAAS